MSRSKLKMFYGERSNRVTFDPQGLALSLSAHFSVKNANFFVEDGDKEDYKLN